jgi:hypothetical protein
MLSVQRMPSFLVLMLGMIFKFFISIDMPIQLNIS